MLLLCVYYQKKLRDAQTDNFIKSCNIEPTGLKVINGYHFTNESGKLRLLVPPEFTEVVRKSIHTLGHFGRRSTYNTKKKSYY